MSELMGSIEELEIGENQLAFYWLAGSTIMIKNNKNNILIIDPCFSDSAHEIIGPIRSYRGTWGRMVEIPIKPEETRANLILFTHDHTDHYDPFTVPGIDKNSSPLYIGPGSCHYKLREQKIDESRIIELNPGEDTETAGYYIKAFAAGHTPDCIGIVLEYKKIRCCILPEGSYSLKLRDYISSLKPIDILFIGANGKFGAITPEQGAEITCKLKPAMAIPIHYGLYRETHEDPCTFKEAVEKRCGNSNIEIKIMDFKQPPLIYGQ